MLYKHLAISTFHSLGVRMLREDGSHLGLKENFSILDSDDVLGVLRDAGAASFSLDMQADDYFDYHHTADDTFDKVEPARIRQSCAVYAVFAWMAAQSPLHFGSGPALKKS